MKSWRRERRREKGHRRSHTEETGNNVGGSNFGNKEEKKALTEPGKTNRKVNPYFSTTEKELRMLSHPQW